MLSVTAAAAVTLGLSSGAAFAAVTPSAAHAAASPVPATDCQNAVTPDKNGSETYYFTGRELSDAYGTRMFEYWGDAGDYLYSATWLGDEFTRFCI